jgi:hypothetical protein
MPFTISDGELDFPLPKVRRIAQRFDAPREQSIADAVAREMRKVEGSIRPGMRVAVGVGSRGLTQLSALVRATVDELKKRGARPFIVPAMGSHGGATPQGQIEVLAGYGVTSDALDVPIEASMETELIGTSAGGVEIYWSRAALRADAVLPINRIKVHTDFHGDVESGLSKMLAIGFGKQKGAATVHRSGFDVFDTVLPQIMRVVLEKVNVLGGVASIENALEQVAQIEIVPGREIPSREPLLLQRSRELMPRIPFDDIEVLVVDWLGKEISGFCWDPNITGRYGPRHLVDPRNPKKLVALRLTERTHGNACGIGVGDVTTRALVENIDYQKTWMNNVTSSELVGGKTPIWMPDDRSAIALAIATCPRIDRAAPRFVRIESTMHLREMSVSEALWQSDGVSNSRLEPLGDPVDFDFTPEGHLRDLPLPAFSHGRVPWS